MTAHVSGAPIVTDMRAVPVAGQDSMLPDLSGAQGAWLTRDIVILTDSGSRRSH